jgi:hypothetical protein
LDRLVPVSYLLRPSIYEKTSHGKWLRNSSGYSRNGILRPRRRLQRRFLNGYGRRSTVMYTEVPSAKISLPDGLPSAGNRRD